MNKQLLPDEIALLAKPVMTRREKLMRFVALVRAHHRGFGLYHNLESFTPEQLQQIGIRGSAFEAAAADPLLHDAGLIGESVADAQRFFELSQHELHEFSCDCGGAISNEGMARRIASIAGPAPVMQIVIDSKSWTG